MKANDDGTTATGSYADGDSEPKQLVHVKADHPCCFGSSHRHQSGSVANCFGPIEVLSTGRERGRMVVLRTSGLGVSTAMETLCGVLPSLDDSPL